MSDEKQIEIKTVDDFLRYLDTGRQAAVETLGPAGISETMALKWLQNAGGPMAGITISSAELQPPVYVTLEIEAAFQMLWVVERIKTRVTGSERVELFELVLDGVRMNDFRNQIYRSRWLAEDHKARQRKNSKRPRSVVTALAESLKHSPDWQKSFPKVVGAHEMIHGLKVTMQSDGRFLIEDPGTRKRKTVWMASIGRKIRT